MRLRETLDFLKDSGADLVVHTGKACLHRVAERKLGILRAVQRDLQLRDRKYTIKAMRPRDHADLVQQLHCLHIRVEIVEVKGTHFQFHVVELQVGKICLRLFQQRFRIRNAVPCHCFLDPAIGFYSLGGLDIKAALIHALNGQIGVQCLDLALVKPVAKRNDDRCELRHIPSLGVFDEVGAELDRLAASVGVISQIVEIADAVFLTHPQMTAVLRHQRIQDRDGLFIVGVISRKIFIHNSNNADGKLTVVSDFCVVNGDHRLKVLTDRPSGVLRRRLCAVVEECKLALASKHPVSVKVLVFREDAPRPDLFSVLVDGDVSHHTDDGAVSEIGGRNRHHEGTGRIVFQHQLGVCKLHVVQREGIVVDADAIGINRIHRLQPPLSEINGHGPRSLVDPKIDRPAIVAKQNKLRDLNGSIRQKLC